MPNPRFPKVGTDDLRKVAQAATTLNEINNLADCRCYEHLLQSGQLWRQSSFKDQHSLHYGEQRPIPESGAKAVAGQRAVFAPGKLSAPSRHPAHVRNSVLWGAKLTFVDRGLLFRNLGLFLRVERTLGRQPIRSVRDPTRRSSLDKQASLLMHFHHPGPKRQWRLLSSNA